MVVHQIHKTHAEAIINLKVATHLSIIHQAMVKEIIILWIQWAVMVNLNSNIHPHISLDLLHPVETLLLQQISTQTQ